MRDTKGVWTKGDPAICMVVGCGKRALYRKGITVHQAGHGRTTATHGYCSAHREKAFDRAPSVMRKVDRRIDRLMADLHE